jgi:two-component system sensor histidine kinase DegS
VDSFQNETGIDTKIEIIGEHRELTKKTTVLVFRIVQEALSNARKHSGASQVRVNLLFARATIKATIQDNGRGFDVPGHFDRLMYQGKLGLMGMQQRTQVMGGSFIIHSGIGQGTTVSVEVGT